MEKYTEESGKPEQRLKILEAQLQSFAKYLQTMVHRFNIIEKRFNGPAIDLEAVAHRLNTIEAKLHAASTNRDVLATRLNTIEHRLKTYSPQLSGIDGEATEASFSKIGEDRIVSCIFERLRISLADVRYLDLGSGMACRSNNSYLFYLHGATGCLVEADPAYFPEYKSKRPRDIALHAAVLPQSMVEKNRNIDFYRASDPSWSTVSLSQLELAKALGKTAEITPCFKVPAMSIREILGVIGFQVDFLSIDIAGFDLNLMREMDFAAGKPKVILIRNKIDENNNFYTPEAQSVFENYGYTLFASTYVNSIFVDSSVVKNIIF